MAGLARSAHPSSGPAWRSIRPWRHRARRSRRWRLRRTHAAAGVCAFAQRQGSRGAPAAQVRVAARGARPEGKRTCPSGSHPLKRQWSARKPCARRRLWNWVRRNATRGKPSSARSLTSAGSWPMSIASGWPRARQLQISATLRERAAARLCAPAYASSKGPYCRPVLPPSMISADLTHCTLPAAAQRCLHFINRWSDMTNAPSKPTAATTTK